MISVKIASIIAIAAFATGSFFAPPVQQAIAAVIATDVQCTGCVGTSDLAGNGVTAAKIKDSEVKAAEIATDAVGAAEIAGVTKMLFAKCEISDAVGNTNVPSGEAVGVGCNINGVTADDQIVANANWVGSCFATGGIVPGTNHVSVALLNTCNYTDNVGTKGYISLIVYHK
jgi:hypothetical protein